MDELGTFHCGLLPLLLCVDLHALHRISRLSFLYAVGSLFNYANCCEVGASLHSLRMRHEPERFHTAVDHFQLVRGSVENIVFTRVLFALWISL